MSTTVIINPQARSGLARSQWAKLAPAVRDAIGDFDQQQTACKGDGAALARTAIENDATRIVVFGGDGTISEVADGIVGSKNPACALGIIPFGTGNDLCRSLGITRNPRKSLEILRRGRIRQIDVGQVSFVGSDGERCKRCFVNAASLGLSPAVNRLVEKHGRWLGKRFSGRLCYLLATLVAKSRFQPVDVRMSVDRGETQVARVLAVVLANGKYFGGGIQIAEQADTGDGQLYSVVVQPVGFAKLIANLRRLYGGDLLAIDEIDGFHLRQLYAEPSGDGAFPIELDGEIVGRLPATFQVLPKAICIIA